MLDNYVGFPDGSVQLKNSIVIPVNNIDTDQIKNGAITTGKINNGAVSHDKLADNSVETNNIKNSAVTTDKINDGAITNAKMANNSVDTNNVKDGAITADKIAEGVIPEVSMHNYSTEEQIVGTWENADGTVQPLYEKTIYHIENLDGNQLHNVEILVAENIDIKFVDGYSSVGSIDLTEHWYNLPLNSYCQVPNDGVYSGVRCGSASFVVVIKLSYNLSRISMICATVQYTKTTDTPVTPE